MPLLDLKTKLKDLKFGTLAPYIQKDINNPGIPSSNQIQARAQDLERLVKMFGDKPGIEFTTKQVILEASKADRLVDIFNKNTIINPGLRIANILAQVPVNRTGTHFLALGGGPLTNYYTLNNNAASEALAGRTVRVTKTSRLTNKSSELDFPGRTKLIVNTISLKDQAVNKQIKLPVKPALVDTRSKDSINLLDVGKISNEDTGLAVTFNSVGSTDSLLTFRGFVQNISDNFNANWQGANYVGRMEQFFTYTGFTRTFSFQLVIPIFSAAEQPTVYNKVNSLVSYTAPKYVNNLPQGNIVFMTLGNYLRTYGLMNSVNITVANDVPWSYSNNGAYSREVLDPNGRRILPQVLTANIQFTPIHSTVPQVYTTPFSKSSPNMPYINQGITKKDTLKDDILEAYKPIELEEVDLLDEFKPLLSDAVAQVTDKFLDFGSLFKNTSKQEDTDITKDLFSRFRK